MRKYSPMVNLIIAMVAVVIIGSTVDVIDATFGTQLSAATGIWFAVIATLLLAAYIFLAVKNRKMK